jgi:hypothetical protein
MAKSASDYVIDGALLRDAEGNLVTLCSAEATTYLEATSTFALADAAMTPGDGNDYTIADGDTSGRKVTLAAKNGETVDANGTVTHAAVVDTANTRLLRVTTVPSQVLTAGNGVNFGSWKAEIADPT